MPLTKVQKAAATKIGKMSVESGLTVKEKEAKIGKVFYDAETMRGTPSEYDAFEKRVHDVIKKFEGKEVDWSEMLKSTRLVMRGIRLEGGRTRKASKKSRKTRRRE
jgi:adenine-specific DNA methylase